jgi:uncharacterized hydantoinase/oxoprolinase family protein
MVGLDARDGSDADWLAMARAWRERQLAEIASQLQRVLARHGLGREAQLVRAGCGAFLVDGLATRCGLGPGVAYADIAAAVDPAVRGWAQVCAPCIAVAALLAREDS